MNSKTQAMTNITLNIPGTFDVAFAYVCKEHLEEYKRIYPFWLTRTRPVSSLLEVNCSRCEERKQK